LKELHLLLEILILSCQKLGVIIVVPLAFLLPLLGLSPFLGVLPLSGLLSCVSLIGPFLKFKWEIVCASVALWLRGRLIAK
jgi:hypothetical protein